MVLVQFQPQSRDTKRGSSSWTTTISESSHSRRASPSPIHLCLPIDEMELEQCSEAKGSQWTLMQHNKDDLEIIESIIDLTTALYQQKIAVSHVAFPDILGVFAKLS